VLEVAPQVLAPEQQDTPGEKKEDPTPGTGNVAAEEVKTPISVEEEVKEPIQ